MKMAYSTASIACLSTKPKANSKTAAAGNIAWRYMELVRLRSQVHALEAKLAPQASRGRAGGRKLRQTGSPSAGVQ